MYERRFWTSVADNDYQMKSCIMAEICLPTITGRSLHLSSGPVNTKNEIVKIIF